MGGLTTTGNHSCRVIVEELATVVAILCVRITHPFEIDVLKKVNRSCLELSETFRHLLFDCHEFTRESLIVGKDRLKQISGNKSDLFLHDLFCLVDNIKQHG